MSIRGEDVVDFRTRRHLSRKALAEIVGLTEGKIWRIEKKGTMSDDERSKLELAGVQPVTVGETGEGAIPRPTPTPAPPPIAELVTQPPTPVGLDRPFDLDLAELSRLAGTTYDRYVSNSELQTWKRCRRKWWLGWFRGLKLRAESPVGPRQVGDRCHRALKAHYVPGGPAKPDQMLDELERLIVLDRTALLHRGEPVDPDIVKRFESEADLERAMLEGYVDWLAETGADADYEVMSAETYLEAPLAEYGSTTVAIIGKLDVRLRRKSDGVRLFMDHKTVGDLRTPTLTLALDEQMLQYQLLESLNLDDPTQRVGGALYNMIKRSKRTERAKPPFYQRVEVRHNDRELTSYRRRVMGEVTDILDTEESLERGGDHNYHAYPRPARECTWDCIFFAVCPMFDDGSRAEAMLEQLYVKTDPLEYYIDQMIGGTE